MLLIRRYNRKPISNRLAIFAGVMLLISSLAGLHHTNQQEQNPANFADQEGMMIEQPVADNMVQKRASKKKGFKVSLFLFRLD